MEDNVSILDQVPEFDILVSKFKNLNIEMPKKNIYELKRKLNGASSSKVNYVDSGKNNKGNDKKRKGTCNSSKDNKKDKKPLSEVVCYKCGDKGHIKRYCKNTKKKNQNSNKNDEYANAVEQELHMASVTTTTDDWWYDSGETTHVCNNKDLFKTYKETEDGHEVMTGDNHTSKNPVYGFKLCKSDVKVVIELDKVILSKASLFVGKAYACDGITNEIVTQIPQNISVPNLNSNNKRKTAESFSAPRKSERARKERKFDPNFIDSQAITFLVEGDNEKNVIIKIPVLLNVEDAPITYTETITSRNSAFWKEAIDDEMDSLISNNTWELSDLPPCSKTMGVNGYLG
ncbi:zinc finger, CCHC-type containing protein [Tanacetum coccineum]|uniref:Zinc finger, CCHC-type containing protein n=1 Tax=Tanacetum coccineum TaxID=301880 RepID=A0ABQ5C168_9ASTR